MMIGLYFLIGFLIYCFRVGVMCLEMKYFGQWTTVLNFTKRQYGDDTGEVFGKIKLIEPEYLFMSFVACFFWPLFVSFF